MDLLIRHTRRLCFEPIGGQHACRLFTALSHPLVHQYLDGGPPQSPEQLAVQLECMAFGPPEVGAAETWINYAVQRRSDQQWIGRIQATVYGTWAETAYLFGPEYWGQGYATESLSWLHWSLESEHSVPEFWATCAPENKRSHRVLFRTGYLKSERISTRPLSSYAAGDFVFQRLRSTEAVRSQ